MHEIKDHRPSYKFPVFAIETLELIGNSIAYLFLPAVVEFFPHSFYFTFLQNHENFTCENFTLLFTLQLFKCLRELNTCRASDQALISVGTEGRVEMTAMHQSGLESRRRAGNAITALHINLTVRHPWAEWELWQTEWCIYDRLCNRWQGLYKVLFFLW